MNIFIIVLQIMLGSVFLLSGFLAVRQHKTDWIEIPFSHSLFSRKDMTMMNTHFDSQKQGEMAADTETFATDLVKLAGYGFTSEEIVSLLWLQQWYQAGGSDRVELVRHWEFLKLLVLNDKLDV